MSFMLLTEFCFFITASFFHNKMWTLSLTTHERK